LSTLAVASGAHAATVAWWDFENTAIATSQVPGGSVSGQITPVTGAGFARGVHANTQTNWTAVVGNPGTAFQSNRWNVGDYYEFVLDYTNIVSITDIQISFDHESSFSGPGDFQIQASTDGVNFVDLLDYATLVTGASGPTFDGATRFPEYLVGPVNLPDNTSVVRIVSTTTRRAGLSSTFYQVTESGRSRIDNALITGDITYVPEPGSLALLGLGGLALLRRTRRQA
jgi:hypothetical protein